MYDKECHINADTTCYITALEQIKNSTTTRSLGFNIFGCDGSSSTESGVQWTPSITVPSLIAIKCRLLTTPSIVAMYLYIKVLVIRRGVKAKIVGLSKPPKE